MHILKPDMTRRHLLIAGTSALIFPQAANANPLLLIKFIFGLGARRAVIGAAARAATRSVTRRGVARAGAGGAVAGGSTGTARAAGAGTMARGAIPRSRRRRKDANPREAKWTKDFIEMGLENLVTSALERRPSAGVPGYPLPDNSVVYRSEDNSSHSIKVQVTNTRTKRENLLMELYLYDIDAGLVEKKLASPVAVIGAQTTWEFDIFLGRLNKPGRKVLCVGQGKYKRRISEVFYVV